MQSKEIRSSALIEAIYRYPVKGLSPEPLERVDLTLGDPLPHDRRYAIENGPSGFDAEAPAHLPKFKFLMLARNERLATLRTSFDDATERLTIEHGSERVEACLATQEGRTVIETFFARFVGDEMQGPPKVLEAKGFSFSDTARRVISIINLASVQALEDLLGVPIDPLRFRGNIHVMGMKPWAEFDLVGRDFVTASGLRLRGVKRIERCGATNVDPLTGQRDLKIPLSLKKAYGHTDCGLYVEVISGGPLATGDRFSF
jgi:uncharacterized protein YcbX